MYKEFITLHYITMQNRRWFLNKTLLCNIFLYLKFNSFDMSIFLGLVGFENMAVDYSKKMGSVS